MATMEDLETVLSRAVRVAEDAGTEQYCEPELLVKTLEAIGDEWPLRDNAISTLHLYLIHDARGLARALNLIADEIEKWDNE